MQSTIAICANKRVEFSHRPHETGGAHYVCEKDGSSTNLIALEQCLGGILEALGADRSSTVNKLNE
jgi:hypothetical protein